MGNEQVDEQTLIAAAKANPQNFGAIYDLYFDRIYAYAYNHTGQHADAEDVTAQAFKQAFENLGRFEWRGVPFGAWLYRITSNIITGQLRKLAPPLLLKKPSKHPAASRPRKSLF